MKSRSWSKREQKAIWIKMTGVDTGILMRPATEQEIEEHQFPKKDVLSQNITFITYEPNLRIYCAMVFMLPEPPKGSNLDMNVMMECVDNYLSSLPDDDGSGYGFEN